MAIDDQAEAALSGLERTDRDAAQAARSAYESLTGGQGSDVITGHGVADFLWYQLPTKWACDLAEKLFIARALGELFARLDMPWYAALCLADSTADIIATYERHGRGAGVKAYRSALASSGLQPPDLPGALVWGSVMGLEEAAAYWSASAALEQAIAAGKLRPGTSGWRRAAVQITTDFLDSQHDDVTGTTWLQWVHTERLQRFAESRATARARLAEPLADALVNPLPVPDDADEVLTPMRWLLNHTADGAALTATGNLTRPLVAEGCRLFDWLTLTGNPRSESDIVELGTLRDWAAQMGVVRRSGRQLLLSTIGRNVRAGGAPALWRATMDALLGPTDAEAAAGETALMLLLTDGPYGYGQLNVAVAEVLVGEGWRNERDGEPISPDQAAGLLATLRRRLDLLGLTSRERLGTPAALTITGRVAAHTALRARALRARQDPMD